MASGQVMTSEIIGYSAAILTTFSFIPQIFKVIRYKTAKDVSLITLLQLSCGVILWIVYGFFRTDIVIILANSVTIITLAVLLYLYCYYSKKEKGVKKCL